MDLLSVLHPPGGTIMSGMSQPRADFDQLEISGGLPVNLDALLSAEDGKKPFYPYSTLIRYAIKGSPNQKLLLEDIYFAIETRFPYFVTAPAGWKNSVRHNLSLNPCFDKVPRPLSDRGKGSYWTVNENVDPRTGITRVRRKAPAKGKGKGRGKGRKAAPSSDSDEDRDSSSPPEVDSSQRSARAPASQASVPESQPPQSSQIEYDAGSFPHPIQLSQPVPNIAPMGSFPYPHPPPRLVDPSSWRYKWMGELANLQNITAEEEFKSGDSEGWYQLMYTRVKHALAQPLNDTELAIMQGTPAGTETTQPTPPTPV